MLKPNFLIIGAPKAGTTSLYNYLSQHPEIGFSKLKEPKYFSFRDVSLNFKGNKIAVDQIKKSTVQDFDAYQDLFKNIDTEFIGEASPNYFHVPAAAKNIYDFNPDMKLIVILRNPIEKTYSDWKHNVAMGYETQTDFRKALSLTEKRRRENYVPYFDYLEKGKFASHIERYYRCFEESQLKIIFFDDFKENANDSCNEILEFLGIDKSFSFDTSKVHMEAQTLYKSNVIRKTANYIGRNISNDLKKKVDNFNKIDAHLSSSDKDYLKSYFEADIKKLENITNRNLSCWLQ